jgi:outer membrane protein with beta-barrel domain
MLVAAIVSCAPAVASADSLFGVLGGGFFPKRESSRTTDDVLVNNLIVDAPFLYDIRDFDGGAIGGEYLIGLGDWIEAGVGATFYQKTVDSQYDTFEHADGTPIAQDIKMRIVPVTASVRFFPVGRTVPVQPYVGGGVNFYRWKYSEGGEFVDFDSPIRPRPTFVDEFSDDGTATGAVFIAGVRAPLGNDRFFVGGEFRWQGGRAELDPSQGFTGSRMDLGGASLFGTFHVKF